MYHHVSREAVRMQKATGSWTKFSAMTMLLCVCLGAAYGWHSVQQEKLAAARAESDEVQRMFGSGARQTEDGKIFPAPWPQYRGSAMTKKECLRYNTFLDAISIDGHVQFTADGRVRLPAHLKKLPDY
jgi:hypothetical protein